MDFRQFFDQILFSIAGRDISLGQLSQALLLVVVILGIAYFSLNRWLPNLFEIENSDQKHRRKSRRLIVINLVLILLLFLLIIFQVDYVFHSVDEDNSKRLLKFNLTLQRLLKVLLVWQLARLLSWVISEIIIVRYEKLREKLTRGFRPIIDHRRANRVLRPTIYLLAFLVIIHILGLNFIVFTYGGTIVETAEGSKETGKSIFRFSQILGALLIIATARLLIWILTEIALYSYYQNRQVNPGTRYAINRLLSYFIIVIALLQALQYMGINLTLLWGGAAALLVGVGLGLQQTFNDLTCGIILLFERTVEVGDMLQIDEMVGAVKSIGLRTSLIETRDSITVIVPNSKLVGEAVINWSHFERKARFHINIGVAYGSDTELVKKLLIEIATNHQSIFSDPKPIVRFTNFGDSSLDFELHFWSREFLIIEDVKSDLRFAIDAAFREHNISIPFPQRDIWMRREGDNI